MPILSGLIAGLLFGMGLAVSGLGNPAKVLNFLDLTGTWDPSLAFVMGGAIAVTMVGFRIVTKRARPLFSEVFHLPTRRDIDPKLVSGAVMFGLGWGLGGYCPGPVWVGVLLGNTGTYVFLATMLLGMAGAKYLSQPRKVAVAAE